MYLLHYLEFSRKRKILRFLSDYWIVLIILLVGGFLRFYKLGEHSLWYDEILSTLRASQGLHYALFERFRLTDFFIFLELFVGNSEFIIRFYSALFGILGIVAIYICARNFFDERVALLSSFFLSLNAFHIFYSRDARYYSVIFFLSTVSCYFFLKFLGGSRLREFVALLVVSLLGVVTHPTFLFLIGVQLLFLVFLIVYWLLEGFSLEKILFSKLFDAQYIIDSFREFSWILRIAIICIICFSLLVVFRYILRHVTSNFDFSIFSYQRPPLPSNFSASLQFYWEMFREFLGFKNIRLRLSVVVFFVFGLLFSFLKGYWRTGLFSLLLFASPVLFIWTFRPHSRFIFRYVMFLKPFWVLYIAYGVVSVFGLVFKLVPRYRQQLILLCGASFFICLFLYQSLVSDFHVGSGYYAWREIAKTIHENHNSGDIVYGAFLEGNVAVPYYLSKEVGVSLVDLVDNEVIKKSISMKPVPEGMLQVNSYKVFFRREHLREYLSDFYGGLWSAGLEFNHQRAHLLKEYKFPGLCRGSLFEYRVFDTDFNYELGPVELYRSAEFLENIKIGEPEKFIHAEEFDKEGIVVYKFDISEEIHKCYLRVRPYVLYEGNYLEVWYSTDGVDYKPIKTVQATGDDPVVNDVGVDLSADVSGADRIYIRLNLFANSESSVVSFDTRVESLHLFGTTR